MAARFVNKPTNTHISGMKRTDCAPRVAIAGRTAEVRAVGAWVQPEPVRVRSYYEAVHSAKAEERRIQAEREEKEARLKRFQDDVKKRVAELARIKRKHELEKSYQAVEDERNIVRQTFHAAERLTPRKNRCSVRDNDSLAIRQTVRANHQGARDSPSDWDQQKQFDNQKEQLQRLNREARRNLMSRRVITEAYEPEDLPGGVWREGPGRDHPVSRRTREGHVIDVECDSDIDTIIIRGNTVTEVHGDDDITIPKTVHFEDESETSEDVREYRIHRKSGGVTSVPVVRPGGVTSVPVIRPGVQDEEEKKRVVSQRALYRRLFMDIEREQVKESLRRKEHRRKINELKKTKEVERREAEREMIRTTRPVDPLTGETPGETLLREREQEELVRQEVELSSLKSQKIRESQRYLEALRQNLREKLELKKVELPALCACGTSLWDTNPQTCANNCVFYHNPRAYARALQSLLASCDVA